MIIRIISDLFLFIIIFFPGLYPNLKAPFLIITLGYCLISTIKKGIYIEKKLLVWFLMFLLFSCLWCWRAAMRGNPGTSGNIKVLIGWSIIYMVIVNTIKDRKILDRIIKVMFVSGILVCIYNILLLLNSHGIWPDFLTLKFETYNPVGIHDDYSQIVSNNIGLLTYIVPFAIIYYLTINKGKSRKISFLLLLLGIIVTIVCSRRALVLCVLLTPILFIILDIILYKRHANIFEIIKSRFKIIFIVAISVITLLVIIKSNNWSYSGFFNRITSAVNDSDVRYLQLKSLYRAFNENYLLGSGFGIGVKDVIRNVEKPWTYELTYSLLLYNTGVVGIIWFSACMIFLFIFAIRILKKNYNKNKILIPNIVAFAAYLVATATNPYLLSSFAFMWPLFLFVASINVQIKINK